VLSDNGIEVTFQINGCTTIDSVAAKLNNKDTIH
jgi:hypothetical protein